ncbi:TonB-dependent receptor [Membranicola marinus]|uniref:TonB-dependent receptor n=1 Tax=Membranihabitans marinus TaxID=1227546 RepID=A0A953HKV9_9BACT|nr:TonB-dependent receptor [Membranihabitans marinus]MBY5956929.1 TonB-dependent receptor [Membranihabitans marinus]
MKRDLLISLVLVIGLTTCSSIYKASAKNIELPINVNDSVSIVVIGVVTNHSGETLPGVNITVVGDTRGVSTDIDGRYEINVESDAELLFTYIGMQEQQVSVEGRTEINVVLEEKASELEGLTVVAFGTQKKESVIASVTSVNPKELKVPSSNLTTALAGRMAGLIAYQRSGEPGEDNAEFFIRGVTSFGYTASPLILLDGLEISTSDLSRLQPDDIASFTIMKDASAAALYGARGANGVILVTTKEGKEGKAQVSVRYEQSISSPTKRIELADPITYMNLHNEAILTRDPLGVLKYSREKIEKTEAGANELVYPATNWHDMLFKNSTMNNRLNFNVSGGGEVARYYIAGTFNQDNGLLKVDQQNNFNSNIDLKKYLLRSNVNINVTKSTEVVVRLHGTFDDYKGPLDGGKSLYQKVMRTNPVLFPPFYPKDEEHENTRHILFGNYETGNYLNPYADMMRGYKDYTKSLMLAQFEAKQDLSFIAKGLRIRGLFSTTRYSFFDVNRFYSPFYYNIGGYDKRENKYSLFGLNPEQGQEHLSYSEGRKDVNSNTYLESAINYDKTLGEDHLIGGMVVFYLRNELEGNAGSLQKSLAYRNMGLSGRTTYGYKSRYFLEANFGYNGSERFSKENRFGFFPSIGAGWMVSNESFWGDRLQELFPILRLKATHGLVGNDAIGGANDRFFHLSQVNIGDGSKGYTFGSDFQYTRNGVTIERYQNPNITWETAEKTNFGIEVNMLNMIDLNIDLFSEHRRNILMNRAYIPTTMGLQSTPRANVGEAKGQGVDVSVDVQKNYNSGFWYIGRFNLTYATSEFKVYEEPNYFESPWKSRIGHAIGQRWGYVAERLFVDELEVINSPFQSGEVMAGDIKYKDINDDGVINELDQVPIGYPTVPEVVYGFGLSTGYGGFDLSFFFQGLARESFWIDSYNTAPFIDTDGGSTNSNNALLQVYADSHWSESNRDLKAIWPRLSNNVSNNNNATSTWFMRNGSFLRLKTVEVGYNMPSGIIDRIGLGSARWYVSGVNLLTISAFNLWDPEMAGNGLGYPIQRTFNIGLQATF